DERQAEMFSGPKQTEAAAGKGKEKRIPFSPKSDGGEIVPIPTLIERLAKSTKTKLSFMGPGRRRAAGSYSPPDAGIRQRVSTDVAVAAHEVGQTIDDQFGILADVVKEAKSNPKSPIVKQLLSFAKLGGSNPPKGHPTPLTYRRGEGFAEWLRCHIMNPD